MEQYIIQVVMLIMVSIILATSLNLINGMTGQFSLGHAGFMAVGAYSSAIFTKYPLEFLKKSMEPSQYEALVSNSWIMIIIAVILAGCVAALIGLVVGIPVLRLRGDYLAIVTLGFGEIIRVIIQNLEVTGGATGLPGIPGIKGMSGVLITFGFAVATIWIIKNIMESSEGRAFVSIREDDIASEAMGVNITIYKVMSFVIGAFFAGIAGGLFAHINQFLSPNNFNIYKTVDILLMVVLGGMGSLTGSILGAVVLTIVPELLRTFAEYRMIVYSLTLVLLMLLRPDGILGKKELFDVLPLKKRGV